MPDIKLRSVNWPEIVLCTIRHFSGFKGDFTTVQVASRTCLMLLIRLHFKLNQEKFTDVGNRGLVH